MAITMTQAAAERVRKFIEKRGKGEGLRVGVRASGCSGKAYVIEYADKIEPDDHVDARADDESPRRQEFHIHV